MIWSPRKEEETFKFKPKVETKKTEEVKIDDTVEKLSTLSGQVELMSRYLTYLSKKFDQTIDSAITYDKSLDALEQRIEDLKKKVENMEIVEPAVEIEEKSGKRAI